MRRLVFVLLLVILTVSMLWGFSGRQISSFVDQYKIQTIIVTEGMNFISYEGTGDGGVLSLDNLTLSLAPLNPHVGTTKDNQLALAHGGKVFSLGPIVRSVNNTLEADVSRNRSVFRHGRSYFPWPVFEKGAVPRLNRNEYYDYACFGENGQQLKMLWSIGAKNASNLIRVEISDAPR